MFLADDRFLCNSVERKKKFWCRNIFTSAIAIFNASALWERISDQIFNSFKTKQKKIHIKFSLELTKSKILIIAWSIAIRKCLIWAIGLECHNGFLNVYFPCIRDKILQFSWHLSKRRDILLALENLPFYLLSKNYKILNSLTHFCGRKISKFKNQAFCSWKSWRKITENFQK